MANNIEVARAVVTIVPTMEGAQQTITNELTQVASSSGVAQAGQNAGSNFAAGLGKGLAVAGAATAAVTAAAVKAADAFVSAASDVAAYGDNIDKMSQKMGISATAYQEWDFVMQHCGTSMESLKASMKTLASAAETNSEAFERLGLSQEDIANMSQEDLFGATIEALQQVEDETERTYLAGQLLGRGATELGPLLNMTAEETAEMKEQLHELGGVMSDEDVKAAAAFDDQLQDMQTAFSGLKRGMMSEFLPALTGVAEGLTDIFTGNYDQGLEKISQGIDQVVSNISDMLPKLIEIGGSIIESLAEAIISNLDKLLPVLVDVVMGISNMIIENLPLLIETGVQLILQIALGIAEALPDLLPTIVDVVIAVVDTLIDNVDLLIDASIALIIGLATGLINALPRLLVRIPEIIIKIVETLISSVSKLNDAAKEIIMSLASGILSFLGKIGEVALDLIVALAQGLVDFKDKIFESATNIMESFGEGILGFIDKAKNWGHDLIDNFVGGIKDKINSVVDACKNIAGTIADYLGFSEPEKGPLSDFHTYAPDMIDLFTEGLEDSKSQLEGTLTSVLELPANDMLMSAAPAGAGAITIPVYIGQEKLDTIILNSQQRQSLVSGGR